MAHMTLEELVRQLGLAYGQGLRCVALYGSAARGEHVAQRSDLNVLVLVDAISMGHLQRAGATARAWTEGGNPPPLTLTVEEWRGSADIFPIEYADILAHHRVLHGALPIDGLRVERRDLRLQLEHEAMSKLLRLRHAILASSGDARALGDVVDASVSSMLVLVRACLRLAGEEPPADSMAMLDRAQAHLGLDVDTFRAARLRARGGAKAARGEMEGLAADYLAAVGAVVRYLDRQQ